MHDLWPGTLEAIVDWNNRCEPPWSEFELAHKLDSIYADAHDADDWGQFLADANGAATDTKPRKSTEVEAEKPSVGVNHERHRVIDEVLQILPLDPDLYLQGDVLVRMAQVADDTAELYGGVTLRKSLGSHVTHRLDPDGLSYHLTRLVEFYALKTDKHGARYSKPAHPPTWLMKDILGCPVRAPLRQLNGLSGSTSD